MATYIRLTDYKSSDEKEQEFFNPKNRYEAKQEKFYKIPTSPVAYWVSDTVRTTFTSGAKFGDLAEPKAGMQTNGNDRFLRLWCEVDFTKVGLGYLSREDASDSGLKWFPYNKGGSFRKWFGNMEYLVNFENDGYEIKKNKEDGLAEGRITANNSKCWNQSLYFKAGLTWSTVSSTNFGVRFNSVGNIFDITGSCAFPPENLILYTMAFLQSNITQMYLSVLNPTMSFQVGNIKTLPIVFPKENLQKSLIEDITQQNIDISKEEWDSRETSWDFTKNELIKHKSDSKIETAYTNYYNYWKEKFNTLHQNEEELNRLFIDIYELQDELTPDVELKDITILKNEAKIVDNELVFQADEIMKQFISYGVGVMFGRYSLDSDGLLIANMGQEVPTDTTFEIDDDNVIPVLEDDYFKDDIASRFVQFVKAVFGEEDLSENIRFIESSLKTTLRKYFVKGFYEDHIKRYKKRPIYWMVASAKKGFMSLIYMHRYEADTFARVRNSYLTEYIAKLEAHKETLTLTTSSDTASDRDKKDADKQMKNIDTKLKEIIEFDRDKMMSWSQNPTEIDLDDGVKVNYCKFRDILYPITGLCK